VDIPYGGNVTRNLLYHLYPTKHSDIWKWNVSQLLRRMDCFNGQKIVSICTDDKTVSFEEARETFQGTVTNFIHSPNDPSLGEVVNFYELLKRIENIDPRQIVMYLHAKGVKYDKDTKHMVHRWAEVMYSNMLDYPHVVEDSLLSHPFCGTFLKSGNAFADLPPSYHFAGTFFAARHSYLFDKPNWHQIPRHWWGTEAWPGIVCPKSEADCLLMEGLAPTMQLYSRKYWKNIVNPIWREWQIKHASLHRHCSYNEVLNTLRLLGTKKMVISGPQRSGTMITSKMLAKDLKIQRLDEMDFNTYDFNKFKSILDTKKEFVIQAPTMSAYLHLFPYTIVYMRRNLQDILRSQKRIDWDQFEQLERDRYFDHTRRPSAVIKTEAWEGFQRIDLGERAFDLDYESLKSHPMWVDPEKRKGFGPRQTCPSN
jgi:hypothetical protein